MYSLLNEIVNVFKIKVELMSAGWSHLAGPAVPVGGGTGQEMVAGVQAPTPAAGAATTAECPVQIKDNGQSKEGRYQPLTRGVVEETSGFESRRERSFKLYSRKVETLNHEICRRARKNVPWLFSQ